MGKSVLLLVMLLNVATAVQAKEYFVATTGDDLDVGSISKPWRNYSYGLSQLAAGDTLTLRAGTYRIVDEPSETLPVLNQPNVTLQGFAGEKVRLLGSANTAGLIWEKYDANIWRLPADYLTRDPVGMFNGSRRIEHQSDLVGGRDHDFVNNLVLPDYWTKADINGDQCFRENAGCYIYLFPAMGENPNSEVYEIAQRALFRVGGNADFLVLRNLEFYYASQTSVFIYGADFITVEDNIFAHTSNSNDNSYGIRIWYSEGSVVRSNKVYDSKYWGGVSNSKGITFMITKAGQPNIVEYNEVYDIPGYSAVGTKGGASNLIIRYNYIHDVYAAFSPGDSRCVSSPCVLGDPAYRPGGSWVIYGNIIKNAVKGIRLAGYTQDGDDNILYNNVFFKVNAAVDLGWNGTFGNVFVNNMFVSGEAGIYLQSGGTTTTVEDYLPQFESHNNLFFDNALADIHLRPNWGGNFFSGTPYDVATFQAVFAAESTSLAADPLFIDTTNFRIDRYSPAVSAGDGTYWGVPVVHIGIDPLAKFGHRCWYTAVTAAPVSKRAHQRNVSRMISDRVSRDYQNKSGPKQVAKAKWAGYGRIACE